MSKEWFSAKSVKDRYDTSEKWVYHQQKNDPDFPKGVKFSDGMTRWSRKQLDEYDKKKMEAAA